MSKRNIENLIFTPLNHLPRDLRSPRLHEEVLAQIHGDPEVSLNFSQLNTEQQEALIQFCMGNRGLKITYDPFFQKIFNPETHPDRLNRLLSSILKQPAKVIKILPREGIRLSENASLIIMDILVELDDGSLINVEIQKYGYLFPMQRSFCYGADLLVRQYAKLRASRGKAFTYKDMRPVYVIVLMDESPADFAKHPNTFIHHSNFSFDTGLSLGNLLNFIYISLDIFRNIPHNNIEELDAWLLFLSSDDPHHIHQVVEKYPFFQELYKEIINFRYHPKELITMYSEALAIMDRNTVNLMIDEMKQELEQLEKEKAQIIADMDILIANKDAAIADKDATIADKDATIAALKAQLAEKNK